MPWVDTCEPKSQISHTTTQTSESSDFTDIDTNASCSNRKSHLVLQHVYVVIRCLWPLLCHFLQVTQQVWHIDPELLWITYRWRGVTAGRKHLQNKSHTTFIPSACNIIFTKLKLAGQCLLEGTLYIGPFITFIYKKQFRIIGQKCCGQWTSQWTDFKTINWSKIFDICSQKLFYLQ